MSASHMPSDRGNPLQVEPDRWNAFLADFTRANRGAHARLEVLDPNTEMGRLVPTEDRPFQGISIDTKDRERTVWLAFGGSPQNPLTHSVRRPTALRALTPSGGRGAVLEIEGADGSKTVLELTLPESYALSGGEPARREE